MVVVFYDRKNKREVRSDQLFKAPVHHDVLSVDVDQADEVARPLKSFQYGSEILVTSEILWNLGYKSADCPSYLNYDMNLNESDLVFLRLEE